MLKLETCYRTSRISLIFRLFTYEFLEIFSILTNAVELWIFAPTYLTYSLKTLHKYLEKKLFPRVRRAFHIIIGDP